MAPPLVIRAASRSDDDALWALLAPALRAGDTYAIEPGISREDALVYWSGPPNQAFVAEEESRPVGTFYLRPNARGGGSHVANAGFVTAEAARGRGLARAMLRHAEAQARRDGFLAMQFNFVVATNTRALHIWRSEGYETVGRLPRAFRHPTDGLVDAVVMHKFLEGRPDAR
jgi:ribosomal protein S18 acetylase RimI-like enzyme